MSIDRPLRVLHVIDSLGEAGAEQNLLTLLRYLPRSEYEHHLAWIYQDERLLPAFAPLVASTLALGGRRGADLPRVSITLARHIRRLRPDVVSATLIHAQVAARLASYAAGCVPTVSTWQCTSYRPEMFASLGRRGDWLRRLTWVLDAGTGIKDAHFIAVSREVAEHNARVLRVASRRVSVIFNAFDPGRVIDSEPGAREALRRDLGVRDAGPLLLSVGRLVRQKDHETSIDAMPGVLQSWPHAVLAIAGPGPLAASLDSRARSLDVHTHVRLLGARTDVPALLAAADLLVSASRYEGHSVALMEALAAGLPAVLSRIPSFVDALGDAPSVRYFALGDAAELSATIAGALANLAALRAAASIQAHEIRKRFGPDLMAKQYDDVFRTAARRRAGVGSDTGLPGTENHASLRSA